MIEWRKAFFLNNTPKRAETKPGWHHTSNCLISEISELHFTLVKPIIKKMVSINELNMFMNFWKAW